jgi:hypothetical protein
MELTLTLTSWPQSHLFGDVVRRILSMTGVWVLLHMYPAHRIKTVLPSDMPFKSEKQKRFLYANEPAVARKFQKEEDKMKGKKKKAKKK